MVDRFDSSRSDEAGCGFTLRWARVKKGLTQEEAARLAGIDQGTLARWEKSDKGTPRWMRDKLNTLCRVLGVGTLQSRKLVSMVSLTKV